MAVNLSYDFTTEILTKDRLQTVLNELATAVSQITNADIIGSAGISQSKLAQLTTAVQVEVPIHVGYLGAAGWPNGSVTPVVVGGISLDQSIWTVKTYKLVSNAIGIGGNTADLSWGYYFGGVYTETTNIVSNIPITYSTSGIVNTALGSVSGTEGVLALRSTSLNDATLLGGANQFMSLTLVLERTITI